MSAIDLWYQKLQKSITLPFGNFGGITKNRLEGGSLLLYAIELVGLEFKQLSDGEYSLTLCFFDFQTRRFGGGQWRQKCTARQSRIHLDQHLLFRSVPSQNASIVIVAEFGDSHGNALCWAAIPLGGISQQIEPSTSGGGDETIRAQLRKSFPLYAGSSRVLFLASSGLNQLEPHLRPLDAIISVSLRILGYSGPSPRWGLPAFHFVAQKEIEEDELSKFTALLDNLRLEYSDGSQVAGDSFLLDLIGREYCYALNRPWREGQPPSGLRVLERRLKIGAHDGLGFLEEPLCVLLEAMPGNDFANQPRNSVALRQRSQSLGSRSGGQHSGVDFCVRQSVRLRSLPTNPDLAIIFQLEYLVGCPLGNGQELLANAHLIRVAWTAWCPCLTEDGQISQADTICVHLLGGPRPSPMPFGRCLRDLSILPASMGRGSGQWPPLPPQRVRLNLHFNFVPLPEDADGIPKAISRLSVEQQKTPLPRPDRLPIEEMSSPPTSRRPPSAPATSSRRSIPAVNPPEVEDQLLLTVQIPKQQNKRVEEVDSTMIWPTTMMAPSSQQQLPTIEQFQPSTEMGSIRMELPLGRVHPLPRQMIPLMAKFPAISGQPGPPPKIIDIQSKMELNLEMEGVERRWPSSEFSLQFLAFLPAQSAFPLARQPPRLFFSFQFYRFEEIQTEALFGEASTLPADGVPADDSPMLLWREGGRQPGLTTRFVVDPGRKSDFATYLFGHQLHLHIWEADTLFHLGCASIPLRFLLRQGAHGVQCSMQAPIFQSGFPPSWQPSQGGTTLNGLLFLRMANVGLPESAQKTHPIRKGLVPALRSHQQGPLERFLALQKLDLAQRSARLFGPSEEKRLREWAELKGDGKKAQQILAPSNNSAQKFLFAEELAAYKAIRREGKAMALLRAVFASITTKMQITITLGQLRLFPFKLRNPMAEEFICELETTDDQRIRPILDVDEWNAYFRQQGGGNGGERILWEGNGPWRIGIRAMEQLDVPMRFVAGMDEEMMGDENEQEFRVFVRRLPSGHPLAILNLHIQIRRPFISQHFHWHTEECRKLIRSIGLQKRASSVRCSDPTVLCQLEDAGHLLRVECQIGESPQIHQFLLFLYDTKLPIQLQSVWRISIHSFGQLHSETVQGQPIRIPLPLPTSQLATIVPEGELISLNCSPPIPSLRFHPGPVFPATNFGTSIQPAVLFSLAQLGRFHLLINAIRTASQQPIGQWILNVAIGQPNITKVFQVIVPAQVQQIVHKRIPLDNPLGISRQFQLSSSDCSLITVPQPLPPPIGPNSSIPIQLDIHPPPNRPGQYQAFLFVQDAQTGSQEEAFQLNIRFH